MIVPDLPKDGQLQIQSVHPGYEATAASKTRGETKREQKWAYKAAMKALQDDYHENVASLCGLTRLGPRRQRLNRKEKTEQQRQARSLAKARAGLMTDLEKAKAQAKEIIDDRIAKTQAEAQTRVDDVTMQMHQRIETLKQKAHQRISEQQKVTTKLENELALKEEASLGFGAPGRARDRAAVTFVR
ncbi:DNA anti-recombination protein RmuC [Bradyrhizobium sp. GM7.3]